MNEAPHTKPRSRLKASKAFREIAAALLDAIEGRARLVETNSNSSRKA